tara:strand:- start:4675 stop:8013 length:3339 start_codon:yes stop_codon:yes gene_type:complete
MKVRLVAYRRENTGSDTYDLDQFELDLQKEPSVVVNYNWLDLKNPSQRKSSFSQTLKLPFSNANNKFFENYFNVNLDTLVFNAKFKFPAILYIDSIPQLKGFIQLKSIYLNARLYEVALFGDTADFFTDLKDSKLKDVFDTQDTTDPDLLLLNQLLDHKLTLSNVLASWTSPGLTTVLGATTNDVMYPVFDYGHTHNPYSSSMFWNPDDWTGDVNELGQVNGIAALNYYGMVKIGNLKPAIRIQRLFQLIAAKAGYTIESTFLGISGDTLTNTDWFSRIFMTLSTENQKVQTVFNTSSGSEAPFIGFLANMTATQTESVNISNDYDADQCYLENVIVNNEVYDPNNLFNATTLTALAVEGAPVTTINCPSIQFPIEPADEALLPSGTMQIQTTLKLTTAAQTNLSNDYEAQLTCRWYSQSNLNDINWGGTIATATQAPYESMDSISVTPDSTLEYVFTNNITPIAGEIYFCIFTMQDLGLGSSQTVAITIENCIVETLQTDEIGLMSGGEEGIVQMRHNMPDMSQSDFVKDIINKFNLIIKTDAEDEKKLIIEPYQDFVNGGSVNYWTEKLDLSKEQVVKTTNELQSRLLTFGDLEDEDFLNQRYNEKYNIVYGTYKEKRDNDFATEEFKNFTATSPLIAQGISLWDNNGIGTPLPESNIATAYLFEAPVNEPSKPLEGMKPKLFYYSGTPVDITGSNPSGTTYSFHIYSDQYIQTADSIDTGNTFPLCTQYNLDNLNTGVTANTKILHWTYYSPNFNTGFTFNYFNNTYSEHGFYYDYWVQYINEIYSDEARIMECYVNLSPTDIQSFAGNGFKNTYLIKNCLWRVISIDNYLVGGNKSTKVTLLKVIEKIPSTCDAIPTITETGLMTWVDAGTGSATTITNECCEEQNENWTFVQTNATTGVGQCYATGGDGSTTVTDSPSEVIGGDNPISAMMPNITSNNVIQSSTGYAQTMNFVLEATTNGTSTTTFNYGGILKKVFQVKFLTVSFIKIKLLGTVKNGTNYQKVGYFEYDTVLGLYYGGLKNIGGTTLTKQNKDAAFTAPTVSITTTDSNGYWQPTISGGAANETCNWICEVSIISKSQHLFNASSTRAIYQNADNILMQNLDYLLWN